jgi:hypothetical protein
MPGAQYEYERLKHLLDTGKIGKDEPCKVVLPRVDAKERIRQAKKSRRITFACDETTHEEFHVWREAYLSKLHNNPTLFGLALIEAMKTFDILAWVAEQAEGQHVMGKDLHNAE